MTTQPYDEFLEVLEYIKFNGRRNLRNLGDLPQFQNNSAFSKNYSPLYRTTSPAFWIHAFLKLPKLRDNQVSPSLM